MSSTMGRGFNLRGQTFEDSAVIVSFHDLQAHLLLSHSPGMNTIKSIRLEVCSFELTFYQWKVHQAEASPPCIAAKVGGVVETAHTCIILTLISKAIRISQTYLSYLRNHFKPSIIFSRQIQFINRNLC